MENFIPIGKIVNNVFSQITNSQIETIHNRHLARILGILEENQVERNVIDLVKKEVGLYGYDIKNIIHTIGRLDDDKFSL